MAMRLSGCGLGSLPSKWAQAHSVPASAAANNQQYQYRFTVFTNSDTGPQAIGILAQKPAELEAGCRCLCWTPPRPVGDALGDCYEFWLLPCQRRDAEPRRETQRTRPLSEPPRVSAPLR